MSASATQGGHNKTGDARNVVYPASPVRALASQRSFFLKARYTRPVFMVSVYRHP